MSTRRPGKELAERQEMLPAKMVHDDETWAELGRQFPGHTLQSLKENFFTKQVGKPWKRGRKPALGAMTNLEKMIVVCDITTDTSNNEMQMA
ncbi:hypothetical protein ACEPPN_014159 [Leptodophora sp. 'Broadleaf-Isolate-01']